MNCTLKRKQSFNFIQFKFFFFHLIRAHSDITTKKELHLLVYGTKFIDDTPYLLSYQKHVCSYESF